MANPRASWKRVKLGDVAINSTAATKDYASDGYTRYIIGKHIPEHGRVTTWNPVGDAEFGSRIRTMVQEGDVICTTRGPKLKVAVADFDCLSAHTNFILRPKAPTTLCPAILEAVIRSDGFQDHLRKHFRGSTNLFVNWSDAAQYQFALPPLEEQRRLVEVLGAAAKLRESHIALIERAEVAEMAEIQARFAGRHAWPHFPMHQCCEIQLGQQKHPKFERGENMRPFLRVANLSDGYLDVSDLQHMSFPGAAATKHQVRAGDLLVTEGDLIGPRNVGRAAMFRGEIEDCCVQKTLIRVRPRTNVVLPGYLLWAFRHLRYDGTFAKAASGSTVAHLVQEKFREISCPVAPRSIQEQIADAADRSYRMRAIVQKRVADAMALWQKTLNTAVPQ
jgi:type I restriction enzyme, S subunit